LLEPLALFAADEGLVGQSGDGGLQRLALAEGFLVEFRDCEVFGEKLLGELGEAELEDAAGGF
jgi:hypothetical protein